MIILNPERVLMMRHTILFLLLAFASTSANAEGMYIGMLAGTTKIDTGVSAVSGARLDETGTGTSFFIGNDYNDQFAVEGFYTNLGEASLSGANGNTFVYNATTYQFIATATIKVQATSMGMAGKYGFDMGEDFRGYFKAGFHSWETKLGVASATGGAEIKADGTDLIYGVGAEYKLGEKTSILLGYDNYKLDDENVTFLNTGLKYKF